MANSEEIKGNVLKLQNAGASSQDIEDYVKLAVQEQSSKPSILSSIVNPIKQLGEKFLSPLNPFQTRPIQFLEEKGEQVKSATQESISNLMRRPSSLPIVPKAIAGTAASLFTQAAPFTPSEFSVAAADIAPSLLRPATKTVSTSMANRFLNPPKAIAESRLFKGKPTVGETLLERPEIEELQIGNKRELFERATNRISEIGKKVKSKIKEITTKEESNVDIDGLGDREVFNNVLDSMLKVFKKFEPDRSKVQLLEKVRNSKSIDFKTANELREILGDEVGKRFNRLVDDLPELTQAQVDIFGRLRNQIGRKSKDIDELLGLQHDIYDIRTSIVPEAAKGFKQIPHSFIDMVLRPIESSIRLAKGIRDIPKTRGLGVLASIGSGTRKK